MNGAARARVNVSKSLLLDVTGKTGTNTLGN